jgi:hypothetical protein
VQGVPRGKLMSDLAIGVVGFGSHEAVLSGMEVCFTLCSIALPCHPPENLRDTRVNGVA